MRTYNYNILDVLTGEVIETIKAKNQIEAKKYVTRKYLHLVLTSKIAVIRA